MAEQYADGRASFEEVELVRVVASEAANEADRRWQWEIEAAGGDLGEGYHPHQGHSEACAAEMAFSLASRPVYIPGLNPIPNGPESIAREIREAVLFAVDPQPHAFVPDDTPIRIRVGREEDAAQAALLRDIFGNPFQPVSLDPTWLSSTVQAMATGIYAERAFDRMPILADALEEAGCDNLDILNHCRGPGTHVLGCWVVDLLLGKE